MYRRTILFLLTILLSASARPQATSAPTSAAPPLSTILSWFPADTETFLGVTGPLPMPGLAPDADGVNAIASSGNPGQDAIEQFWLLQLLALKNFKGLPILTTVEGSRNFRQPTGLGMAPFQGAQIAVFGADISARANAFLSHSALNIVRTETIAGHRASVFSQKYEQDTWTTYFVFPRPNVAVVATDPAFLAELLARLDGRSGERALPASLPEWKFVDTSARFWAIRHFRPATDGPPSLTSGFNMNLATRPGKSYDATGLAFHFDPARSNTATITYLAAHDATLQPLSTSLFPLSEPGAKALDARYRNAAPGALAGTYTLTQKDSAQYFVFVLMALLGHAILV